MKILEAFLRTITGNKIIILVAIAITMDTVFGVGRAAREKQFNSCVGIDGAIRKISMIVSITFLVAIDSLVHINLIGFIPGEVRSYFPASLESIGLAEFFGLLYMAYEVVSILKNMSLCGLPVKNIWKGVQRTLGKYTAELPDTEEKDQEEAKIKATAVLTDDVPGGALQDNEDGTVNVYDDSGNKTGTITREAAEAAAGSVTTIKHA